MVKKALHYNAILIVSITALLLKSCSYPLDARGGSEYVDDFETVYQADSLFAADKSRWTYTQQTLQANRIDIDSSIVHGSKHSVRFIAARSAEQLSKCSISKSNMYFAAGDVVEFSAWYYLVGTQALPYLFLVDMEENVAVGAGPGIRIALDADGRSLEIERGKMLASTLHQSGIARVLPRDQWVNIRYQIKLSQSSAGSIRLWQNNELLIEAENIQTMPHDILYFIQGTKGVYNSIEVGITANSNQGDCVLYMDDVRVRKIE